MVAPKALAKFLSMLFATYGGTPLTEECATGYITALGDLSAHDLRLAFQETLRMSRSSFPPKPGEIRGYLEAARERMPKAGSRAQADCKICAGTGWRMVEREDGKFAVRCNCIQELFDFAGPDHEPDGGGE